jgi:peptide/nickel transport system substrate-binding protein
MGASLSADGKWQYNGEPVVLIGLIRSEDERTFLGNYLSDQLEEIGFTVDRQVRTRTELSPIWGRSVPAEGQYHFYTGGWGYNVNVINSSNLFDGYYNPRAGSTTLEQAYVVSPEFDQLSMDLANNKYANMEERREMFARALELSLQESQMVWVASVSQFYPRQENLQVSTDVVAGVAQASLYPYTLRWKEQEGGTIRIANQGILTGAWNPISGQDWVQEVVVQKSTVDDALLSDPYTGLYWPQRLERAEVLALNGLPMSKTLDWVDLQFTDEIQVPTDAWADWDAAAQKWITAGERFPDGATAQTKITVYYPEDLWDVKWHDGSNLSVGDFIVNMIQTFDLAKPESKVYDESQVPDFESFMSYFKGVKVLSTDPLVIETYVDTFDLDAEVLIGNNRWSTWFPTNFANGWSASPWHTLTVGLLAEENQELAFSEEKSTALSVTWTHYIDGPSLEIMAKYLDQAEADTYIPYAPTVSQYISSDEAAARYANLQAWYAAHNHFWVGSGPYYLDQVNSVEGSVVTKNFADFPDLANKWDRFGEAMLPVVDVSGPSKVTIGQEAVFDSLVSFKDAPYPSDQFENLLFLLYDAEGQMVDKGQAELVSEGLYSITLSAEMTGKLKEGSAKMEIIAVSKVVAVPVFSTVTFVAAP